MNLVFEEEKLYSSIGLDLSYKHAVRLHHYQIDLNVVARLNLGATSHPIYHKEALDDTFKKYDVENKNGLETLMIGEYIRKPVVMTSDGNFYGFKDGAVQKLYPTYSQFRSEILGVNVYDFSDTFSKTSKLVQFIHEMRSDLQEGGQTNPEALVKTTGMYENQANPMYLMNRIRLTESQKGSIATHFLNYTVLYKLNYDMSDFNKTPMFNTSSRLGMFDYRWIQSSYKTIWKKDMGENEDFKKAIFVGFYTDTGLMSITRGIYRPVYLKPNGWFSDGYADVYPTYETIVITEDMLKKNGMLETEVDGKLVSHRYLVGKIAYMFEWGANTSQAVYENRSFREQIVWPIAVFLATMSLSVGVAIATSGTSVVASTIMTSLQWKLGISAGMYGVSNHLGGRKKWSKIAKYTKKNKKNRYTRRHV